LQAGVAWGMFMGSYDAVKEGALLTWQGFQIIEVSLYISSAFVMVFMLLWFVFPSVTLNFLTT